MSTALDSIARSSAPVPRAAPVKKAPPPQTESSGDLAPAFAISLRDRPAETTPVKPGTDAKPTPPPVTAKPSTPPKITEPPVATKPNEPPKAVTPPVTPKPTEPPKATKPSEPAKGNSPKAASKATTKAVSAYAGPAKATTMAGLSLRA